MSGTIAPFATITDTDKSPVILVCATIGFVLTLLITGIRVWITARGKLGFKHDDFLAFGSLIVAIGSSVMLSYAGNAGLGKHMSTLTARNIEHFFRFVYASRILAILATGLAKASVVMLYRRIDIYQNSLRWFYITMGGVVFWTLFSTFATAFQCQGPHLWQWSLDKCSHGRDYFFAIGILNIATDILIVVHVIPGFWGLKMARTLRFIVISLFCFRFFVVAGAVADLVLLKQINDWSDLTWAITAWAVVDNVTMHLSLITANIPRVHTFLAQLQTGQIVLQITENDLKHNWKGTLRDHYSRVLGGTTTSTTEGPLRPGRYPPLTLRPAPPAVLRTRISSTKNHNSHTTHPSESSSEGVKHWALSSHDPESSVGSAERGYARIAVDVEIHRKESNHGRLHHDEP